MSAHGSISIEVDPKIPNSGDWLYRCTSDTYRSRRDLMLPIVGLYHCVFKKLPGEKKNSQSRVDHCDSVLSCQRYFVPH